MKSMQSAMKINRQAARESLTQGRVKELLHYDHATGLFTRKTRIGANDVGSVSGCLKKSGHINVVVDFCDYAAHRLAWFYVYGTWPKHGIDHIDGDPANNRIENLREATKSQNAQNQRTANRDNKSGYLGVTKKGNRFVSRIKVDGREKWLGTFDVAIDAHECYLAAKRQHHPFGTL